MSGALRKMSLGSKKTLGEEKNAQLEDTISQRLDLENQLLIFAESDSGVSMILQWRIPQELDSLEFRMNNPKL